MFCVTRNCTQGTPATDTGVRLSSQASLVVGPEPGPGPQGCAIPTEGDRVERWSGGPQPSPWAPPEHVLLPAAVRPRRAASPVTAVEQIGLRWASRMPSAVKRPLGGDLVCGQ